MADDFFADLLPMRPKKNGASGESVKEQTSDVGDAARGDFTRASKVQQKPPQEVRLHCLGKT